MYSLSTLRRVSVAAVLAVCVAVPGVAWAKNGPPNSNPGQPFAEILAQIGILNDKIDALAGPGATGPCDIPPVWGKKIAGPDRFVSVLDGGAYCDRETGLVWEAAPGDTDGDMDVDIDDRVTWAEAIAHCARLEVDGRKGWSLPMVEQLASLVDTSNTDPTLPTGHPFRGVPSATFAPYWSATTTAEFPPAAWWVNFFDGNVFPDGPKNDSLDFLPWCVRSGQNFDGNTHNTLH